MQMVRHEARTGSDRSADLERRRRDRISRHRGHHVGSPEQVASRCAPRTIQAGGAVGSGARASGQRHQRDANSSREHRQRFPSADDRRRGHRRSGELGAGEGRERRCAKCRDTAERPDCPAANSTRLAVASCLAVGPFLLATLGRDPRRSQQPFANRRVDRTQLARRIGRVPRILATDSSEGNRRLGRAAQLIRGSRRSLEFDRRRGSSPPVKGRFAGTLAFDRAPPRARF